MAARQIKNIACKTPTGHTSTAKTKQRTTQDNTSPSSWTTTSNRATWTDQTTTQAERNAKDPNGKRTNFLIGYHHWPQPQTHSKLPKQQAKTLVDLPTKHTEMSSLAGHNTSIEHLLLYLWFFRGLGQPHSHQFRQPTENARRQMLEPTFVQAHMKTVASSVCNSHM